MSTDREAKTGLRERLKIVEERIERACQRSQRSRAEIKLLPVTKTVSAPSAALFLELGIGDLAESRPQELWKKRSQLPPGVRWHLVGHLQRNKIEKTLPLELIHSVDRISLLSALEEEGRRRMLEVPVLLEVNASQEEAKHGFAPLEFCRQLEPVLPRLQFVRIDGLMTMAAFAENPEQSRPTFQQLRRLLEQARSVLPKRHPMNHLSMGMSNDFEVAIDEGATIVRLGTILCAGLPA